MTAHEFFSLTVLSSGYLLMIIGAVLLVCAITEERDDERE